MRLHQLLTALLLAASSAAMATLPLADGEVRRIDSGSNKITIRHGLIKNLDMPPMTMVFQVRDPALLAKVKVGDKVQFTAEDANGALTVLTLEPVRK